ncbi:translation elongation factor Ts [bacterium]|nr:translation elongation factor Ts [bacterium]MBU1985136.1 translation elongation factor Ts [bacterium]
MADTGINAALVAELRRETGAGMMDCKKALQESGGDKEKALDYLRKKGIAAAAKRADRAATEGIVVCAVSADAKTAALVEINSETDFVARNELFREFGNGVAKLIRDWESADGKTTEDVLKLSLPGGLTVQDALNELIGKIGEKMAVGRFAKLSVAGGMIGTYIHSDSKLGVLVGLDEADPTHPEVKTLARDLAMQVAASSPQVVSREDIPAEKTEYERGIETERARTEGKPDAALPKIVEGRLNKWFAEVALLEQPFVKDPKVAVRDLIAQTAKSSGKPIKVTSFVRIRVGA